MRITIDQRGVCVVIAPTQYSLRTIERFVQKKHVWIEKHQQARKKYQHAFTIPRSKKDYVEKKAAALEKVRSRITRLNEQYKFSWNSISIRNQKSRWGSCSRKGNLQFNYAIAYLPDDLCDYIIVHELCHLKEHNHSHYFWNLVAKTIPDHKTLRKKLRTLFVF